MGVHTAFIGHARLSKVQTTSPMRSDAVACSLDSARILETYDRLGIESLLSSNKSGWVLDIVMMLRSDSSDKVILSVCW